MSLNPNKVGVAVEQGPPGYITARFNPQVFVQFPADFRGDDIEQFAFESGGTRLMRAEIKNWWDEWRRTA